MKFYSDLIYEHSFISKFWNSPKIHLETQWFSWKEGPFQNWHDIWSENSDFPNQKLIHFRHWPIFGAIDNLQSLILQFERVTEH